MNGPERERGVATRFRVGNPAGFKPFDLHAADGGRPDDFMLSDD